MKELEIIPIPSRHIKAYFIPHQNRIEISTFLSPSVYDFCLRHEKEHAELYSKHGVYHWRNFWIDIRDRWHIYTTPSLLYEILHDGDTRKAKEKLKEAPFDIAYNIFGIFTTLLIFISPFFILKEHINDRKKKLRSNI
jgi:hypothetical protein